MWKCQYCEKMNFDDQKICPYCNAPNPAAPVRRAASSDGRAIPQGGSAGTQNQTPQFQAKPYNPGEDYSNQKTQKQNKILKYVLISVAALSVLLMVTVLLQKRPERDTVDDIKQNFEKTDEALDNAEVSAAPVEATSAPVVTEAPAPEQEPIVVAAVADIYLSFGETYQCSTEDFVLPYEIDEGDIVWSCDANDSGTVCTSSGMVTGGNTQVQVDAGYNEAVMVKGTTPDGSELSYNIITGDGKTYDFSWSSGRRNMKNYNGAVILVDPMILDCDGFSIYYEYELTEGSLDTDKWSVWVRKNGTEWIRVDDITVENEVGEVYDIVFEEPMSFSEICVQPETYSDSYSYSDSFAVGYLIFNR